MTEPAPRKSDLGVRVASAVVMVAVAGTALWLGGWPFAIFVTIVAVGVFWEWWDLVRRFTPGLLSRSLWIASGLAYLFLAAVALITMRQQSLAIALEVLLMVIAVDVGAYFAGRTIGGPKIAPKISPSKTWAGLFGGVFGASVTLALVGNDCIVEYPVNAWDHWRICKGMTVSGLVSDPGRVLSGLLVTGALVAVVAQAGDFFESWMKRRAGVKDSGALIPGHGGLFDRTDGLIAVLSAIGSIYFWQAATFVPSGI